jgi:hypothetical protein
MKSNGVILLIFFVFSLTQAHADATVQFECTDAIKSTNKNPVIEAVGINKPAPEKPGGFRFSCFNKQKSETQKAEIPAGPYNIRCVLARKNIDRPDNIFTLQDNKTYYVSFTADSNDLCTAKVSEHFSSEPLINEPESSKPLSHPVLAEETLTPDSSIIKEYFIASQPEQNLDKNDVNVELTPNPGKNNLGTYKIIVSKNKKDEAVYFAKLCIKNNEPEVYRKLQDKIGIFNILSQNQNYPAFAKYAGTFTLPRSLIEKHFKETLKREKELSSASRRAPQEDVEVLLLEAAKGDSVTTLIRNAFETSLPELQRIFETIGQSIGNFMNYKSELIDNYQSPYVPTPSRHVIGFVHRDLNIDNVFYDQRTNKVTLIDYDSVTDKGEVGAVLRNDMDNLFYDLVPLLEKSQNKEEAAKIKTIADSYRKGIESAFNDSPKKLAIVKYYMTFFNDRPKHRFYNFLRKYFNEDELPDFEQIKKDFQQAISN